MAKKTILKRFLIALTILTGVIVILVIFLMIGGNKDFDAPLPATQASKDPAMIARGKYLVYGPAHCASCHTPMDKAADVDKGKEVPLIGGWEVSIQPGTFRAPNLTPDEETGLGKMTDGEIARSMRYSVNRYHKVMFPFMPFQEMSEEDIIAIISYLRSVEPVRNEIKKTKYSLLGKALIAFGAVKPAPPSVTPPQKIKIDSTAEYGAYIANKVANCVGCHTNRDLKTGEAIGKPFAGGLIFPVDGLSGGYTFVSPNLTPHKLTGIMAEWTEQAFISRFKSGRVYQYSQMPWGSFSRMNEVELKALYRYLTSLEPVDNAIPKEVYEPNETLPE